LCDDVGGAQRAVRNAIAASMVMIPALGIAGPARPDAWHGLLGLLRVGLTGGFVAVVLALILTPLSALGERMSAAQPAARPRWQYLLGSAGWLGLTTCCALAGVRAGTAWISDPLGVLAYWSGVAGLAMIGRAACWGRVRSLFWWHRPRWLVATPETGAAPS
jgi:hypothetical protein